MRELVDSHGDAGEGEGEAKEDTDFTKVGNNQYGSCI